MVIQYKCPDCGADMTFDSTTGKLHCDSCGHEEQIEATSQDFDDFEEYFQSTTFEGDEVKQYQCQNCGAILLTDKDTTATNCSFCGSPVIIGDRLQGALAPSKVIPFSISKQDAELAFKKWCKKARLSPSGFQAATKMKSLVGMYVPFWVYDTRAQGDAQAKCTKVRHYRSGDYNVTETSHFQVYRQVDLTYRRIPADASEKMADDLMDRLEPFDYTKMKDFNTPYLAGYLSEKYNYTDKEMFPRIQERVAHYMDEYIEDTIQGYSTKTITTRDYHIGSLKADYALFPVWMVYFSYDNAEYSFLMNGETGKIAGHPPISKPKIAGLFGAIAVGGFLLCRLITLLLGGPVL